MKLTASALSALALATAVTALAAPALAGTAVVLTGDNTLTAVDTTSWKASAPMMVKGVTGKLVGIDVRPSDGMLYGVTADGTVVTIDTKTGAATMKSKLETFLKSGVGGSVDFNPVADRLRIIGTDGTNLRANVDDGKVTVDGALKFAETDMHKGETPMVTAGAYTNSMKGAKETALYDIDTKIGGLLKQAPPNDGVLGAVGKAGLAGKTVAFDIESDGNGGNTGWVVTGTTVHKIDLATAKTTTIGDISGLKGTVRDIAILPGM